MMMFGKCIQVRTNQVRHSYDFVIENVPLPGNTKPQTVNLKRLLDEVFSETVSTENDNHEPDVQPLKELFIALTEDSQKHNKHGLGRPREGVHACARKGKRTGHTTQEVYCRYSFPREFFPGADSDPSARGAIKEDPFHSGLRNVCLRRNDMLLNNFEGHIDWRTLINLWSVLEYLTKYATKPGKDSKIERTL